MISLHFLIIMNLLLLTANQPHATQNKQNAVVVTHSQTNPFNHHTMAMYTFDYQQYLSQRNLDNGASRELAIRILRDTKCPEIIPSKYWNEKEFVRDAVTLNGVYLRYASKVLQYDFEIALAAVGKWDSISSSTSDCTTKIKSFLKDYHAFLRGGNSSSSSTSSDSSDSSNSSSSTSPLGHHHSSRNGRSLRKNNKLKSLISKRPGRNGKGFTRFHNKVAMKFASTIIRKASSIRQKQPKQQRQEKNCNVLFVASKIGLPWNLGMKKLIKRVPDQLSMLDGKEGTGLSPFMMMATSPTQDLNTIFKMICACPTMVRFYDK